MIRAFLIQKLCFRSHPSERSFSHAKCSRVLTASSPDRSLIMLDLLTGFFLLFFLLVYPGWSQSCEVYTIFFHVQVFLRTAGQEGRSELGQILSVLWMTTVWWTMVMPVTSPQHHTTCHVFLQDSVSHTCINKWIPAEWPPVCLWACWTTGMAQRGLGSALWALDPHFPVSFNQLHALHSWKSVGTIN